MADEDDLLDDEIPYKNERSPWTPLYACPAGEELWKSYRLRHPEAPESPPENSDDWTDPDSAGYWVHFQECDLCAEDGDRLKLNPAWKL